MTGPEISSLPIELFRRFYAEEIRAVANLTNPALIAAFGRVPRERFLPPAPWQTVGEMYLNQSANRKTSDPRDLYHNVLITLKSEKSLNNGQPSALATWINALGLQEGERVFHVGCGTGYYTAILAETVGTTGSIIAADSSQIWPPKPRKICVAIQMFAFTPATPPHSTPVLVMPSSSMPESRTHICHGSWPSKTRVPLTISMAPHLGKGLMVKVMRQAERFTAEVLSMVAIYSSPSVRDAELEPQLNKAFESRELLKLKSIRLDAHERIDTCIAHGAGICISTEV